MDDTIVFRHLTVEDLKRVIDLELKKVRERLLERGLKLELTDSAKEFLIKKGSNTDFGARPLRRAVENFIEDPLSENLLKGEFQGKFLARKILPNPELGAASNHRRSSWTKTMQSV